MCHLLVVDLGPRFHDVRVAIAAREIETSGTGDYRPIEELETLSLNHAGCIFWSPAQTRAGRLDGCVWKGPGASEGAAEDARSSLVLVEMKLDSRSQAP